ncbi:universal stress protein [Yanghanlia caeni]|uniref:Universal stress protein n=1 Tax=Yanghanlia caeni TaxID=3064283 RepID=A0ABU1D2W4_9BURK|nr:universal stress protein [Alcaligenaceae bacterium LG-2]HZH57175.1 universal stress protein [Burkholderiaceae bacterium]
MSAWKSIAVFIDYADPDYTVLDYAGWLAERCDSHLIGVFNMGALATGAEGFTRARGAGIQAAIARRREREQRAAVEAAERLTEVGTRRGVSVEFRVLWRAFEAEDAILNSLHCDLVVIGDRRESCLPEGVTPERVVFEVGVPVIIVPENWKQREEVKRVVVGWNATREARRAITDALPIITMADETTLLVVDPEKRDDRHGDLPGSDAALSLARHGARVQTRSENSYGRRIEEVVLSVAEKEDADLIVMGAYSKPRRRQLLFGGVTRSMLSNIRYPLLISR